MAKIPRVSCEPGGHGPTRTLTPRGKLWTHVERTYKQREELIAQPCIETTIQGWPVTLLKFRGQTSFTFAPTGSPGEISDAQFLAAYGSKKPEFVFGLISQLANVGPRSESPDVEGLK